MQHFLSHSFLCFFIVIIFGLKFSHFKALNHHRCSCLSHVIRYNVHLESLVNSTWTEHLLRPKPIMFANLLTWIWMHFQLNIRILICAQQTKYSRTRCHSHTENSNEIKSVACEMRLVENPQTEWGISMRRFCYVVACTYVYGTYRKIVRQIDVLEMW